MMTQTEVLERVSNGLKIATGVSVAAVLIWRSQSYIEMTPTLDLLAPLMCTITATLVLLTTIALTTRIAREHEQQPEAQT